MTGDLTQKELLQKTGLSYDRLKDWEKAGIVPAPIRHEFHGGREGQDAIYEVEALERIEAIQKYHYSTITQTWGLEGLFHLLYIECFSFPKLYEREKEIIERSVYEGIIPKMRKAVKSEKNKQGFVNESEAISAAVDNVLGKYMPPKERNTLPKIDEDIKRIGFAKMLGENQNTLKESINALPIESFSPKEILEPLINLLAQSGYSLSGKEMADLQQEIADTGRFTLSKYPDNYKWKAILNEITLKKLKQLQIILQLSPERELLWRPETASILLLMYIALKTPLPSQSQIPSGKLNEEILDVALLMFRKIKAGKTREALETAFFSFEASIEDTKVIVDIISGLCSLGGIEEGIIDKMAGNNQEEIKNEKEGRR
ncbi:MAG: hypothetical protein ABFD08_17665 [Syntrophomonas sp.]